MTCCDLVSAVVIKLGTCFSTTSIVSDIKLKNIKKFSV